MNKKDHDNIMSSFKLMNKLAHEATNDNRTLAKHSLIVWKALESLLDKEEITDEQDKRITKEDEGS